MHVRSLGVVLLEQLLMAWTPKWFNPHRQRLNDMLPDNNFWTAWGFNKWFTKQSPFAYSDKLSYWITTMDPQHRDSHKQKILTHLCEEPHQLSLCLLFNVSVLHIWWKVIFESICQPVRMLNLKACTSTLGQNICHTLQRDNILA